MREKDRDASGPEDRATFDRRFKHAVVAFSIVEFIVIVLAVFYKLAR